MSRVYLGRLSNRATERDIERFFRSYGRLSNVMVKNGYAFVEFDSSRDARDAVYELNGQVLCGERVIVEHAKGTPRGEDFRRDLQRGYELPRSRDGYRGNGGVGSGPPIRTRYRIIVKNLSSKVSWQDLKDFMRKAGEVSYSDAHREHKNEGIVEYTSYREVKKALDKLDGVELQGRKLELIDDTSSRDRGSGRRRGSRSRSGSAHSDSKRRSHKRRVSSDSRSRSASHDRKRRSRKSPMSDDDDKTKKSSRVKASQVSEKRDSAKRGKSSSSSRSPSPVAAKRSRSQSATKRSRSQSAAERDRSQSAERENGVNESGDEKDDEEKGQGDA